MKLTKVAIGKLKIDKKLVRLRPTNAVFVSRYRQAYRAGALMPRLIVNEKNMTVVSGNHRLTAMQQEYPAEHEIEVELRSFANDRAIIEEFARDNSAHGNALDGISRKRISRPAPKLARYATTTFQKGP